MLPDCARHSILIMWKFPIFITISMIEKGRFKYWRKFSAQSKCELKLIKQLDRYSCIVQITFQFPDLFERGKNLLLHVSHTTLNCHNFLLYSHSKHVFSYNKYILSHFNTQSTKQNFFYYGTQEISQYKIFIGFLYWITVCRSPSSIK